MSLEKINTQYIVFQKIFLYNKEDGEKSFRPHITVFLKLYCHFAQKNLKIIPLIKLL